MAKAEIVKDLGQERCDGAVVRRKPRLALRKKSPAGLPYGSHSGVGTEKRPVPRR